MDLMSCDTCEYITLIAKGLSRCNKVTNRLILRSKDCAGFSGGSNVVMRTFKSRNLSPAGQQNRKEKAEFREIWGMIGCHW